MAWRGAWCGVVWCMMCGGVCGVIVQLPSREPRNCEKCKVFRMIHVPNGFMNKFSFVAQTATLGNFFN